jgi:hypothetical protein
MQEPCVVTAAVRNGDETAAAIGGDRDRGDAALVRAGVRMTSSNIRAAGTARRVMTSMTSP